ncbi:MAG TPA: SDR family oxidoreductase, partial [Anaerolineales bacterium]|nr:SDR family oxidoreductase [Anaerolineales bacterium]
IYRPGLVTGHSLTGASNTDDMLSNLTRACLLLGSVPDLDVMVDIVPVDYVSAAIVHLSGDPKNLGKVYHLGNPHPLHLSRMVDWLIGQGFQAQRVSFENWRMELFRQAADMPVDGWQPYLPLIEEVEESQIFMPKFDYSNTLAGLDGSDIHCPPVDLDLLAVYIAFFNRQGFFDKPGTRIK